MAMIEFHFNKEITSESKMKISTGNLQSIRNKEYPLLHFLLDSNMDTFVGTETWLSDTIKDQTWLQCSILNNLDY